MNTKNIIKDIPRINTELSKTDNTKYSTVNGIKEFECNGDGYVDNIYIEGKSLVNLANNVKVNALTESNGNIWDNGASSSCNKNGNEYTCTTSSAWEDFGSIISVNSNSDYTFSVDITGIADEDVTLIVAEFSQQPVLNTSNGNTSSYLGVTKDPNPIGNKRVFKITTQSTTKYCAFLVTVRNANSTYKFRDFMVLEGDYTDKNIHYFEGLKSIGQNDKIEVLSYLNKTIENNLTWTEKETYSSTSSGTTYITNEQRITMARNPLEVKQGYLYRINLTNKQYSLYLSELDKDLKLVRGEGVWADDVSFIPQAQTKYLVFSVKNKNETEVMTLSVIDKIGLQLFETKNYDKKQILTTLRSLPNGTKDEIVKQGNKYYKIKRCEEIILNGSENGWISTSSTTPTTMRFSTPVNSCKQSGYCISDKFIYNTGATEEKEKIYITSSPNLSITINKSRLITQDLNGFKTWLSQNPVTVVYELVTPITEEISNFNPRCFNDKSTILLNSGVVQGEASFEVTNSLGSELEVLKDKATGVEEGLLNNIYGFQAHKLTNDNGTIINIGSYLDMNNIIDTGFYRVHCSLNFPKYEGVYYLEVLKFGDNYVLQRATKLNSTDVGVCYTRIKNNGTWTSWLKITTTSTLSLLEQQISELEIQAMENEV